MRFSIFVHSVACPGRGAIPFLPNDMEHDIVEIRIAIMAMGAPAAGAQIHFNVSGTRGIRADLQDGPSKIRAAFQAGEARMKHPHAFSGNGFEFSRAGAAGAARWPARAVRAETARRANNFGADTGPPFGVKVIGKLSQAPLLLEFWRQKVITLARAEHL